MTINRSGSDAARPSVAFLFVGGAHQVYHAAPVAAELAAGQPETAVTCYVAGTSEQMAVQRVLAAYGASNVTVEALRVPPWLDIVSAVYKAIPKLPLLWVNRGRFRSHDAIVMPERTSTVLRRFGVSRPSFIHIPHGAGDRAKGFERRISRFDYVIVAGQKDAARMIGEGLVPADRCAASGYVKLDFLRRLGSERPKLFSNDRPVVLYNPHFDPTLSSWRALGERLIESFVGQDRYNLVVAPHVRLFQRASTEERRRWERLAVDDKIIVDLGSERSIDMTYTAGADIYIGDVSSQAYEFAATPRPCLFVDAAGSEWREDPSFAFWHFGEVVRPDTDVFAALDRAVAGHPQREAHQRLGVAAAFGGGPGAARRAAHLILGHLAAKRGEGGAGHEQSDADAGRMRVEEAATTS